MIGRRVVAALLAQFLAFPAIAQPLADKSVAPPISSYPGATSATYGDWVLDCRRLPEGSTPTRICEVVESIQVQGQQAPLAKIAIGRISAEKPLSITIVLPHNISLPGGVFIYSSAKDKGLALNWTRCTPTGCFAEAPFSSETLKQFGAATERGKVAFIDASGRTVEFPLSFRGLPQALDALAKEKV